MQALLPLVGFIAVFAILIICYGVTQFVIKLRAELTRREQDMEFAAHEAKLARMNQIADKAAGMKRSAQRQSSLRVVPKPSIRVAEIPTSNQSAIDTFPFFVMAGAEASPAMPAASYQGNGGSFDGGGASADWPSSDSCSSGSDSGSCGSGD